MDKQELTFGQKAVGLTFNPSGDEGVIAVKKACAKVIDILNEYKNAKTDYGNKKVSWTTIVLFTAAFNAVIAGQMAAVKYITWKE